MSIKGRVKRKLREARAIGDPEKIKRAYKAYRKIKKGK